MLLKAIKQHYFFLATFSLCLTYLILQVVQTQYTALGTDEFWFAHAIYPYLEQIPYRDFSPYKTVLGYYILSIPMKLSLSFSTEPLTPLFFIKNSIAVLNAILFFISAFWLKKFFSKPVTLLSCLFLMFAEFTLSYSTNIRVDFLAYWFCLFSALLLLEKKFIWAGIWIGLGFITSQKALWYIVASDITLAIYWLCFYRSKKYFFNLVKFNLALLVCIAIYIIFWSYLSSTNTVFNSLFYEAYVMHQLDVYDSSRKLFWTSTLLLNPLIYFIWPLAFLSLFITFTNDSLYKTRFFCILYSSLIMLFLIPYKQVFPYYMITLAPAFLLLYAVVFDWILKLFHNKNFIRIIFFNPVGLWIMIFLSTAALVLINVFFKQPSVYLLVCIIPIMIGLYIKHSSVILHSLIGLSILFFGLVYPFVTYSILLVHKKDPSQKPTLNLAYSLLQDGSDYISGIEYFYNKNQPIAGLRHLDAPQIAYLYHNAEKLRPVASLESLYHAPVTQQQVIESLQKAKIKLYINNYRMEALPPAIKTYLATEFKQWQENIYLYAPIIKTKTYFVKFSGNYKIESVWPVNIDGKIYRENTFVRLTEGEHLFLARNPFRITLYPDEK